MTIVRIKGFQIFRDRHGKQRCYHRASRTAVDLDLFPIGSAAFLGECHRITELHGRAPEARPGTLGMLIAKWRNHSDYTDLAQRTKADYSKWLGYLQPIGDTPLAKITPPLIVGIRDKAAAKHGRRFGTGVKQVLSSMFTWGVERGHLPSNPALRVKAVRRPKGAPEANRPWQDEEREAVLAVLPSHMLLPIGLMMFCGLDPQDAVSLPRSAVKDGYIDTRRGKTAQPVWVPLPAPLIDILARSPFHDAITLCATSDGKPWARGASGLRASWRPIRQRLEMEGKVQPGLTFKGLRHTVATILSEMGKDDRTIADLLGQKSPAMAAHYARRADKRRKNSATVADFNAELNNRRTKVVKPL